MVRPVMAGGARSLADGVRSLAGGVRSLASGPYLTSDDFGSVRRIQNNVCDLKNLVEVTSIDFYSKL